MTTTPLCDAIRKARQANATAHVPGYRLGLGTFAESRLDGLDFEGGGALAASRLLADIQPVRRKRNFLERVNATVIDDLGGNDAAAVGVQSQGAQSSWVSARGDEPPSEAAQRYGLAMLEPKFLTCWADVSRQASLQTGPQAEALFRADLRRACFEALEGAAVAGDGLLQPLGLLNTPDLPTSPLADAAAPTRAEVIDGIGAMTAADVPLADITAVLSPAYGSVCASVEVSPGSGRFLLEDGRLARRVAAVESGHAPHQGILLGDWADCIIGVWQDSVMVDPYSLSTSGGYRIVAHFAFAVTFRRRQTSFRVVG